MTRKYKAGDKIELISTPHAYVDISTHTEYTLYETIDGRLVFRDDVNDERAFTERNGTLSDWMQPCGCCACCGCSCDDEDWYDEEDED